MHILACYNLVLTHVLPLRLDSLIDHKCNRIHNLHQLHKQACQRFIQRQLFGADLQLLPMDLFCRILSDDICSPRPKGLPCVCQCSNSCSVLRTRDLHEQLSMAVCCWLLASQYAFSRVCCMQSRDLLICFRFNLWSNCAECCPET